jgi:hypothetical protein
LTLFTKPTLPGYFNTDLTVTPGPGINVLNANGDYDIFLTKLAANGSLIWSRQIGSAGTEWADALDLDGLGNVYIAGHFSGTVDFDPGPGSFLLSASGSINPFLLKLDSVGNFIWARQFHGTTVSDLHVTNDGYLLATGYFQTTGDFDPGPGTSILIKSGTDQDIFVSRYDAAGAFLHAPASMCADNLR